MVPRLYALVKLIQLYFIVCKLYFNKSDIYKASCAAKCPLWAGFLLGPGLMSRSGKLKYRNVGPRKSSGGVLMQRPRRAHEKGYSHGHWIDLPAPVIRKLQCPLLSPVGATQLPTLPEGSGKETGSRFTRSLTGTPGVVILDTFTTQWR